MMIGRRTRSRDRHIPILTCIVYRIVTNVHTPSEKTSTTRNLKLRWPIIIWDRILHRLPQCCPMSLECHLGGYVGDSVAERLQWHIFGYQINQPTIRRHLADAFFGDNRRIRHLVLGAIVLPHDQTRDCDIFRTGIIIDDLAIGPNSQDACTRTFGKGEGEGCFVSEGRRRSFAAHTAFSAADIALRFNDAAGPDHVTTKTADTPTTWYRQAISRGRDRQITETRTCGGRFGTGSNRHGGGKACHHDGDFNIRDCCLGHTTSSKAVGR